MTASSHPVYYTHSNAHANFPSLPESDPGHLEKKKHDFENPQDSSFRPGTSDSRSEQVFRVIETTFRNLVPEIQPDSAPVHLLEGEK